MGCSEVVPCIGGEINVGEDIFELWPEFSFRRCIVIKHIMNKIAQPIYKRTQCIVIVVTGCQQRFGKACLQWKPSIMREARSYDVYVCALQMKFPWGTVNRR